MANDSVINTYLNIGLKQEKIEDILASNAVLDWFGRTFWGRTSIGSFFRNTQLKYDHEITSSESTSPFENRSAHFSTRVEPEDNYSSLEIIGSDEQWMSSDIIPEADTSEEFVHRTPPQKSSSNLFAQCPPAPCRRNLLYSNNSQELQQENSSDEYDSDDDDFEAGIQPLDSSLTFPKKTGARNKRQKVQPNERCSKYSDLKYMAYTGFVMVKRRGTTVSNRRETKLLISYRVNKENPNDIQIALIVYDPHSSNLKSRRNLLVEFDEQADESEMNSLMLPTSSHSLSGVVRTDTDVSMSTSETLMSFATPNREPMGKGTKRPLVSRNSLRL